MYLFFGLKPFLSEAELACLIDFFHVETYAFYNLRLHLLRFSRQLPRQGGSGSGSGSSHFDSEDALRGVEKMNVMHLRRRRSAFRASPTSGRRRAFGCRRTFASRACLRLGRSDEDVVVKENILATAVDVSTDAAGCADAAVTAVATDVITSADCATIVMFEEAILN